MSFNIWEGAQHTSLEAVAKAIRAAKADAVGLQEPFGHTRKLARLLGWYAAPRLHTISRFPILETPAGNGHWGYLRVLPGEVVTIANVHAPSWSSGVTKVFKGKPRSDALAVERKIRVPWVRAFLDDLEPELTEGGPVFFTGDFNAPSWRDWTKPVVKAIGWQPLSSRPYAQGPRYPVRWPLSVLMEKAGFRDSYRQIYPNAIAHPGFTWASGLISYGPVSDLSDRIDFVWAAGDAVATHSRVVGPPSPFTDLVSKPWPSDHRAIVSTFRVQPRATPDLVAPLDLRVEKGKSLKTFFHAPAGPGRTIGVWDEGEDPSSTEPVIEVPVPGATIEGRRRVPTEGLAPGTYTVGLRDQYDTTLASMWFELVDPDAPATIATDGKRFAVGEKIPVHVTGAPGNRYDWIGLYTAKDDPTVGWPLLYTYLGGRTTTTVLLKGNSAGKWPVPPGRYRVHLCVDDDYRCLAASQPFRVTGQS